MNVLKIGETQLEYWDRGSGAPLVFIHGVATCGELWAQDLEALTSDLRLLCYNRRGYGGSSASPRSWEAHAADAIALIEKLKAVPAVVVGYSGGSIIALDIALRRPELVAGIVLLDPAFNLKRCLTPGLLMTLTTMKMLRLFRGDRSAAECWLRYVSSYSTGGSAYESKAPESRRLRLLANAAGLFADLASGSGRVDERGLRNIGAPVTIVGASLSPSFLRRSTRRLKRLIPRATLLTFERSGHWIGLDARTELLELLRNVARGAHRTRTEREATAP